MLDDSILSPIDDHICLRAWRGSNAEGMMRHLCHDLPPRPAGGEGIRLARKYLARALADIDCVNIHEEPVPVRLWHPGSPKLTILGPDARSVDCLHCLFSAGGDVTGRLLDAGSGLREDIERLPRDGVDSIFLIDGHTISGAKYLPIVTRLAWAAEWGAKAVVIVTLEDIGLPCLDVCSMQGDLPIPVVSVSRDDGLALREKLRTSEVRAHVFADGYSEPAMCANLIAELGPDDLPADTVILGAHLDYFWISPGALDNLSGVVTIAEIARLLSPFRHQFRRRLRIVFWTAEEIGFLGSKEYVKQHASELESVRFVLNFDSIFTTTARGMAIMWSHEMRDYIASEFEHAGRRVDVRDLFCMSSDYLPFMLSGVPAARPADWERSFPTGSHTVADGFDNVRIDWVQHNAMVYAQLVARLLTDPEPLPAARLAADEVRSRLEAEDVTDNLRAIGFDIE